MLVHLFEYLQQHYDLPGAGLFRYISFRAGAAMLLALLFSMIIGSKKILLKDLKLLGKWLWLSW